MNKEFNNDCCQFFFVPEINRSMIILIDMQEKFVPAMPASFQETVEKQKILLHGADLLKVPVIVTEQYPKGLGKTIPELAALISPRLPVFEKTTFSCLGEVEVCMELKKNSINTVILVGIEAHVCVLQTALDALKKGFQVIILKDAVNSRKKIDFETGLQTAEAAGVHFMTVESLLFMFMRDSMHPSFREISRLLK